MPPEPEEGLKGRHGDIYQLKLLLLFLKEAYVSKKNVSLSTEERAQAGVFDDVIFQQEEEDGSYSYRLLQAKHKSKRNVKDNRNSAKAKHMNKEEVDSGEFFTKTSKNNAFSVFKYFTSYCAIRQSQSLKNVKEFMLCTNAEFRSDQICVTNVDPQNRRLNKKTRILYAKTSDNTDLFENLYKIDYEKYLQIKENKQKDDLISELEESIGLEKLAEELFNCIIQKKEYEKISDKNDIFKMYKIPLFAEVIENVDRETAVFKADFINGDEKLSPSAKMLRKHLQNLSQAYLELSTLNLSKELKMSPSPPNVSKADQLKVIEIMTEALSHNEFMIKQDEIFGFRFHPDISEVEITAIADELADCIILNKEINVKGILKPYHLPLTKEVINVETSKFYSNFLNGKNISESARKLLQRLQNKINIFNKEMKLDPKYENPVDVDPEKQWTHLPDNDMIANIIKEFCNDFVLALKQPNEKQLEEKIKKEVGDLKIFQLEDASQLVESLFSYVIEWVVDNKNFEPLVKKDINKLFDDLNSQICKGMIIGINSEYCKTLKKFGIGFMESVPTIDAVENFLESKNQWLPIVATHSTLLTAIQVEAAIQKNKIYVKKDSFIFLSLKIELKEEVCKAYEIPKSNNLLVLVGDDDDTVTDEIKKEFYNKIAASMKNENKKFVLILKDNSEYEELVTVFSDFWKGREAFFNDDTTYMDFDDKTKRAIKSKPMIFQGKIMDFNNNSMNGSSDSIMQCIPFDVLAHSNKFNPIELGKEIEKPKNYCNFYSDRMLYHPVEIENNILKLIKENKNDVFAIESYDVEALCQEGIEKDLICEDIKNPSFKVYILDPTNVHSDIENMRENHTGNVRWIKKENEKLFEIKPYDEASMIKNAMNDLFVIFADIAGMGKSTLLYHTAQKIKKICETIWIAKIDLNKYTAKLKEANDGEEMGVFEYMVEKDVYGKNATDYEKDVFREMLKNGNSLIMFDGFDEINPDYGEKVISMLQKLKEAYSCKVWITTRIEFRHILEQQFNTKAYFFEPFSESKQIEFLISYWNAEFLQLKNLTSEIPDVQIQNRLNKYAEKIVKTFKTLLLLQWNNFLGVPLQLKMIAEICAQQNATSKSEKWSNIFDYIKRDNDEEPSLPNLTLFMLYDKFLKEKFPLHLEKREILNFSAIDANEIAQDFQRKQFQFHSILGLKRLMNTESTIKIFDQLITPEVKEQLNQWQRNHKLGRNNVGIIDYFGDDDQPHFAHLTYAEYFAASYLAENMITNSTLVFEVIESVIPNVSPIFEACLNSFVKRNSKILDELERLLNDPDFTENQYYKDILEVLLGKFYWKESGFANKSLELVNNSFTDDVQNHLYLYLLLTYQNKKYKNANAAKYTKAFFARFNENCQRLSIKYDGKNKIHLNDNISIHQNSFFHLRNVNDLMGVVEKYSNFYNGGKLVSDFYTNFRKLLYTEREYGLEIIPFTNDCLRMFGKILYSNKNIIKNFLPSIEDQANGNPEEFYNIRNFNVKNENFFNYGMTSDFIGRNEKLCYSDEIVLLGLKAASVLDETNKCKNMSEFRSIMEILMVMCGKELRCNAGLIEKMLSRDDIEFDKLWNKIKIELENIETHQNNKEYTFINNISALRQWIKHGTDFKNRENYFTTMNEFFTSCKKNNMIKEMNSKDGLNILQSFYNDKYMGVLIISRETGQKKVATFFQKYTSRCISFSELTPNNLLSYLLFTNSAIPESAVAEIPRIMQILLNLYSSNLYFRI